MIKTVESLQFKVDMIPKLVKGLEEAKAEDNKILSISKQVGRRLSVTRSANEQNSGNNWNEDSAHLASSHASTLNDDEFELDMETCRLF